MKRRTGLTVELTDRGRYRRSRSQEDVRGSDNDDDDEEEEEDCDDEESELNSSSSSSDSERSTREDREGGNGGDYKRQYEHDSKTTRTRKKRFERGEPFHMTYLRVGAVLSFILTLTYGVITKKTSLKSTNDGNYRPLVVKKANTDFAKTPAKSNIPGQVGKREGVYFKNDIPQNIRTSNRNKLDRDMPSDLISSLVHDKDTHVDNIINNKNKDKELLKKVPLVSHVTPQQSHNDKQSTTTTNNNQMPPPQPPSHAKQPSTKTPSSATTPSIHYDAYGIHQAIMTLTNTKNVPQWYYDFIHVDVPKVLSDFEIAVLTATVNTGADDKNDSSNNKEQRDARNTQVHDILHQTIVQTNFISSSVRDGDKGRNDEEEDEALLSDITLPIMKYLPKELRHSANRILHARSSNRPFVIALHSDAAASSITAAAANADVLVDVKDILEDILIMPMKQLGIILEVRRHDNGMLQGLDDEEEEGTFPFGWCMRNFIGGGVDVLYWDNVRNNDNGNENEVGIDSLEALLRQVVAMDQSPKFIVRGDNGGRLVENAPNHENVEKSVTEIQSLFE